MNSGFPIARLRTLSWKSSFRNCLIVDNRVKASGELRGAHYITGSSSKAYNNTVWANTLADKTTNDVYIASGTVKNVLAGTLSPETPADDRNRSGFDHRFRNLAKGDFRPRSDWTEVIDRGETMEWMSDATDIGGNSRICNGKPDIGCYERYLPGIAIILR